jgi:hypothetical protein
MKMNPIQTEEIIKTLLEFAQGIFPSAEIGCLCKIVSAQDDVK